MNLDTEHKLQQNGIWKSYDTGASRCSESKYSQSPQIMRGRSATRGLMLSGAVHSWEQTNIVDR